jgi:hypothetical protein
MASSLTPVPSTIQPTSTGYPYAGLGAGTQPSVPNTSKGLVININSPYAFGDAPAGMAQSVPVPSATGPATAQADTFTPASTTSPSATINPALPPTDQLTIAYSEANGKREAALKALADAEAARSKYLNLGQQLGGGQPPITPTQSALPPTPPPSLSPAPTAGGSPFLPPALTQDPFQVANTAPVNPALGATSALPLSTVSPMVAPTSPESTVLPPSATSPAPTAPTGLPVTEQASIVPGTPIANGPVPLPGVPSNVPTPTQATQPPVSALSGAPSTVLNELLLSSNPQNNEFAQLRQGAVKNKGRALPDILMKPGRLQQQDEAIEELAIQAQQPAHAPFPQETFDRLDLLANLDTRALKGASLEEINTLRKKAVWTMALLNVSQNGSMATASLPGLKTMERIIRDPKESTGFKQDVARGLQAILAPRSKTKEAQQIIKRTKGNGKSAFNPLSWFNKGVPTEVKGVLNQAENGVSIAPPPQAPSAQPPVAQGVAMPMPGSNGPNGQQQPAQTPAMAGSPAPIAMDPNMVMMPTDKVE